MKTTGHEQFVLNGRWLFDTGQNQLVSLYDSQASVVLPPVCVRVLTVLVSSPQTLVQRRRLFHDAWRVYGFEVCENSLNQVIKTLRGIFETLEPGRAYIKTYPRIGYSLIADVRSVTDAGHGRTLSGTVPCAQAMTASNENEDAPVSTSRESFYAIAGREWDRAQSSGLPLSLLMLTVDTFGTPRSTPGCLHIDTMLFDARQCIEKNLHRSSDRVTRHHGATFAVLLPDTDSRGAGQVARRLQSLPEMPEWPGPGGGCDVPGISMGFVCSLDSRFDMLRAFVDAAYLACMRDPHAACTGAASAREEAKDRVVEEMHH